MAPALPCLWQLSKHDLRFHNTTHQLRCAQLCNYVLQGTWSLMFSLIKNDEKRLGLVSIELWTRHGNVGGWSPCLNSATAYPSDIIKLLPQELKSSALEPESLPKPEDDAREPSLASKVWLFSYGSSMESISSYIATDCYEFYGFSYKNTILHGVRGSRSTSFLHQNEDLTPAQLLLFSSISSAAVDVHTISRALSLNLEASVLSPDNPHISSSLMGSDDQRLRPSSAKAYWIQHGNADVQSFDLTKVYVLSLNPVKLISLVWYDVFNGSLMVYVHRLASVYRVHIA
ncbi:hypothetical protein Bca4012_087707 [Brassica carinata]